MPDGRVRRTPKKLHKKIAPAERVAADFSWTAYRRRRSSADMSGEPAVTEQQWFDQPAGTATPEPCSTRLCQNSTRSTPHSTPVRAGLRRSSWASTRRFSRWLAAAGAVPLASEFVGFADAVAGRAPSQFACRTETFKAFGGLRIDHYDWLRDQQDHASSVSMQMPRSARLEPISRWLMSLPRN